MDDILGQALRSAEIVTSQTGPKLQAGPREQTGIQVVSQVKDQEQGRCMPAVYSTQPRPQVLIRQSTQPRTQSNKNIIVFQQGNNSSWFSSPANGSKAIPVQNVQGQTLVISPSSNGQKSIRVADLSDASRTRVKSIRAGQTVNGPTVRIVPTTTPTTGSRTTAIARRLIPLNPGNKTSSNVRLVPVGKSNKGHIIATPIGSSPGGNHVARPTTVTPIQVQSIGTGVVTQQGKNFRRVPGTSSETDQRRARVSVQCHDPQGSKPGFIVLTSDYRENLLNTYNQLERCFATSYKDFEEIRDNEHALMPKLKDIYRKADQNYRNYLSKNPLKILDNLKTVSDSQFVTLESYLKKDAQSSQPVPRIRVRPDSSSPRALNPVPATIRPSQLQRFPSTCQPNTLQNPVPKRLILNKQDSDFTQKVTMSQPEPNVHGKKLSAILLRLETDHLDQTNLLNISEPFCSVLDFKSRLLPFHCSVLPKISSPDRSFTDNKIFEPLCQELLTRKRGIEQDFRQRFNNWNYSSSTGEELLMEKLAIESELDEIAEKRARLHSRSRTPEAEYIKIEEIDDAISNNEVTVQMPVDDIDEHDNAVKGLLDVKF